MAYKLGAFLVILVGLVLVTGLSTWATALTIAQALDANENGYLDDPEILQAIQYWVTGEPVPGRGGERISDAIILELIAIWINHTPLGETPPLPPPPPAAKVCRESISGRVLTVPTQYPTIQEAVDNAREGDTILVKPGSYPGGITIGKSVVLEGEQGASLTKIQGGPSDKGLTILKAKDVVIRGFAITGSQVGVSIENSSSVCLEQNDISNNLGPGISATTVSLAVAAYPRGLIIANNRLVGNVGFGVDGASAEIEDNFIGENAGDGIAVLNGGSAEISDNDIANNRGFGILAAPDARVVCPSSNNFAGNDADISEGVPLSCLGG